MSTRYYNRFVKEFAASGGHPGPATLRAVMPLATRLMEAGANTRAAGIACAEAYQLHRKIEEASWKGER